MLCLCLSVHSCFFDPLKELHSVETPVLVVIRTFRELQTLAALEMKPASHSAAMTCFQMMEGALEMQEFNAVSHYYCLTHSVY